MKKQAMPKVDWTKLSLTDEEKQIVSRFVKEDGTIRATKPTVEKVVVTYIHHETEYGPYDEPVYDCKDETQGKAAYVWRHVVFAVSPKPAHQCMPTMDICDLPDSVVSYGYTMNNKKLEALHNLADKVVNAVAVEDWNGVRRWGQALGMIGTPEMRENGTIVYR